MNGPVRTHLTQLEALRLEALRDAVVLPGSPRLGGGGGGGGGGRRQAVQHLPNIELLHFPPLPTRRWREEDGGSGERPLIGLRVAAAASCSSVSMNNAQLNIFPRSIHMLTEGVASARVTNTDCGVKALNRLEAAAQVDPRDGPFPRAARPKQRSAGSELLLRKRSELQAASESARGGDPDVRPRRCCRQFCDPPVTSATSAANSSRSPPFRWYLGL